MLKAHEALNKLRHDSITVEEYVQKNIEPVILKFSEKQTEITLTIKGTDTFRRDVILYLKEHGYGVRLSKENVDVPGHSVIDISWAKSFDLHEDTEKLPLPEEQLTFMLDEFPQLASKKKPKTDLENWLEEQLDVVGEQIDKLFERSEKALDRADLEAKIDKARKTAKEVFEGITRNNSFETSLKNIKKSANKLTKEKSKKSEHSDEVDRRLKQVAEKLGLIFERDVYGAHLKTPVKTTPVVQELKETDKKEHESSIKKSELTSQLKDKFEKAGFKVEVADGTFTATKSFKGKSKSHQDEVSKLVNSVDLEKTILDTFNKFLSDKKEESETPVKSTDWKPHIKRILEKINENFGVKTFPLDFLVDLEKTLKDTEKVYKALDAQTITDEFIWSVVDARDLNSIIFRVFGKSDVQAPLNLKLRDNKYDFR